MASLGMQGQPDGSSVIIFKGSLTAYVTGPGKYIFEGGFKFAAFEARKEFNITDSEDWGEIVEQLGIYLRVIGEQAIEGLLSIYEK